MRGGVEDRGVVELITALVFAGQLVQIRQRAPTREWLLGLHRNASR